MFRTCEQRLYKISGDKIELSYVEEEFCILNCIDQYES